MRINIALCSDDNYSIPCLVCITSIFENNKDESCNVTVLTNGMSDNTKEKFLHLADVYGQRINIYPIDDACFKGLVTTSLFPKSIYYRYLLPQILSNEDKVLYMDCDIIVRHTLSSFYNLDIKGSPCAVVIDQNSDDPIIHNRVRTNSPYWNSGVILMNLKYWREYGLMKELVEFIDNNPDKCIFPDQDAMNILFDGKVVYAGVEYNCQSHWFYDISSSRISYKYWEKINQAVSDPVIIHYCEYIKPWYFKCYHPMKSEFLYYAKLHSFIGYNAFYRKIKITYYKKKIYQEFKRYIKLFMRLGKLLLKCIRRNKQC